MYPQIATDSDYLSDVRFAAKKDKVAGVSVCLLCADCVAEVCGYPNRQTSIELPRIATRQSRRQRFTR
jgi:hypothetical protein